MMLLTVVYRFVITIVCLYGLVGGETSEEQLLQTLFGNSAYDKRIRPVNSSHLAPVEATVYLSVQALQNVNEKTQTITINTWVFLEWTDYRLAWDPALFNDIPRISLQTKDLWTPQVVLENTANQKVQIPALDAFSRVLVDSNGRVLYASAETISSLCAVHVVQFPFDRHNCSLDFTSSADTADLLLLKSGLQELTYKYDKSQWTFDNITGREDTQDFYDSGYSYVHVEIILRRLPLYHLVSSFLPSSILTTLAFSVFILPPESGERMSVGVSILLGLTVFQLVLSDTLPETNFDDQPLLGLYLSMNFYVVVLVLFCTAWSTRVYSKPGPVKNKLARKLFLQLLPTILRVRRPNESGRLNEPKSSSEIKGTDSDTTHMNTAYQDDEDLPKVEDVSNLENESQITRRSQCQRRRKESQQDKKSHCSCKKTKNLDDNPELWRAERWTITMVLDRLFFIITAAVFVFTTLVIFLRLIRGS